MSKREAIYIDGEPANLEAAAADALEWLRWARSPRRTEENDRRLNRTISTLETFLSGIDMVFLDSPKDEQEVTA